jgi:hypothetical protein
MGFNLKHRTRHGPGLIHASRLGGFFGRQIVFAPATRGKFDHSFSLALDHSR